MKYVVIITVPDENFGAEGGPTQPDENFDSRFIPDDTVEAVCAWYNEEIEARIFDGTGMAAPTMRPLSEELAC